MSVSACLRRSDELSFHSKSAGATRGRCVSRVATYSREKGVSLRPAPFKRLIRSLCAIFLRQANRPARAPPATARKRKRRSIHNVFSLATVQSGNSFHALYRRPIELNLKRCSIRILTYIPSGQRGLARTTDCLPTGKARATGGGLLNLVILLFAATPVRILLRRACRASRKL